ncbi:thiamine pyrophosphate-dependent dehydrogenase E1 component subunit alpha [Haliangium sp.]|uniref:thiamine pyrophosphate-dependent dehydrogenase E1 component subunit alpha n=1 Tax=Haliangium sp. TaxID=2663208 RepID=UPI003D096D43
MSDDTAQAAAAAARESASGFGLDDYLAQDAEDKALGRFGLLGADTEAAAGADDVPAGFDEALCMRLYRGMLDIRLMDERFMTLQRQGRIGFYGEAKGQEAAVVGSAASLEPDDWLVPALREAGAGLFRGLPLESYVSQLYGNAADVTKGRQMPCHPCDRDTHYVVMSSCVANQLPHAVGIAWGMKLQGHAGRMCIGYMGDGGTSEGDFHWAMELAARSQAPVVLVCQNNQWAISTPGAMQTAAETIALKGVGYGIESLRADGNDVLACYAVSKYAADKARAGGGPTFIELLTYRVSAHTSSDDPSRYRDESVTEVWKRERDPIHRMRAFMSARGWLADEDDQRLRADIEARVRAVVEAQEAISRPEVDTLFDDVYEQPTWLQREQRDYLRSQPRRRGH